MKRGKKRVTAKKKTAKVYTVGMEAITSKKTWIYKKKAENYIWNRKMEKEASSG